MSVVANRRQEDRWLGPVYNLNRTNAESPDDGVAEALIIAQAAKTLLHQFQVRPHAVSSVLAEMIASTARPGHLLESDRLPAQPAKAETDPVTMLLPWANATEPIRASIAHQQNFYAAAFVLRSMQSLSIRYGYELGNQVLRAFRDHIQRSLPASTQLFRGPGPTVVALVQRAQPVEWMRTEVRKIAGSMRAKTFETSNREAMIAVVANWTVVPVEGSAATVREQIDRYVAAQLSSASSAPARFV